MSEEKQMRNRLSMKGKRGERENKG